MEAESSKMASARISSIRKKPRLELMDDENSKQAEPAQTRKPHRKGNVGKLADLINLPLDLLFEVSHFRLYVVGESYQQGCQIFGTLSPFDLLRVSRTSKEFRRLLMHKSAISVWRTALSKVPGLPDCPSGMTEPQWVNLAFDPHCHVSYESLPFDYILFNHALISSASLLVSGMSNGGFGCVYAPNAPRISEQIYN